MRYRNRSIEQIDLVKKWTDIAFELGSPSLRIFTGGPSSSEAVPLGYAEEDLFRWAVDAIRECAKYARRRGVVLALENHRDFGGRPDVVLKLIQAVDSEWFRHVLDRANYGEHIYEDSKKTAPYAVHVHADATCREMIANRPTSKIDYQRIKEILKAVGYNGYVSIEYVGNEDPNVAVPRLAKLFDRSIAARGRTWSETLYSVIEACAAGTLHRPLEDRLQRPRYVEVLC